MADFGDVVGALLAGLARARRIADEETVALAKQYRRQPLLDGLSVPRVRVPDMTVDMPVIVETHQDPQVDPEAVADRVLEAVDEWASAISFAPPPTLLPSIHQDLASALRAADAPNARRPGKKKRNRSPGDAGRLVVETLNRISRRRFDDAELRDLERRVRDAADEAARVIEPPSLSINPLTSAVKETADPSTVARLRISLREEGLEWATIESADGTQRNLLTPE